MGVWEDDQFIGAILFSRGAARAIGSPFGLLQSEVVELARVALRDHQWPVSRMLRIGIQLFAKATPGIRLIVSLADTNEDHHGGIYQAAGWTYVGHGGKDYVMRVNGKVYQSRTVGKRYNSMSLKWLREHVDLDAAVEGRLLKHKYVKCLDPTLQPMIDRMSKPYPKRPKDSSEPFVQPAGRGQGSTDPDAPTTEG